jgi:hypothetical protein
VRIREVVTERDPENKWGEKQVTQVRVLEPGRFFVYRGSGKKEENWRVPRLVDAGLTSFDEIPMYTVYANQTRFMTAEPPLLDMAQNNVLHWQMSSDINHIVHVSNFPLLYLAGDLRGQGDEDDDPLADDSEEAEAGPNILIQGKVGTSLMFVEHTGKAIEAGEKRISKVEDHMAKMGLDLLIPRHGGPETATGREIDFSQSVSDLEAMTAATASTFDEILRDMVEASSSNESLPEGEGIVILGKNLGLSIKDANDLEALKFARENRDISRLQYLKELKRRRVLEAEYDPEEDEAQLDEEALGDDEGVDDTAFANAEIRSIGAV